MTTTVFVAGTDTGVGKTWTACALARALSERGRRVVAIKPIETGCAGPPSESEDGVALARATGQAEPSSALIRLRAPVAPSEAADREGIRLDFEALVRRARASAASSEIALIEGAGGLLSPITWEHSALDLVRALDTDARVLLVAADRLGTINHTIMSLEILERRGFPALGVVLTAPSEPDLSTGSNARAIARLSRCPRIVEAPRTLDPSRMSRSMEAVVEWL